MPKAHSETHPAIRAGKFLFLHPPSYPYHSSLQEGEHSFPPLPLSLFLPPIERENGFSFLPLSPCVCGCFGWAARCLWLWRGRGLNSPVEGCLLAHSIAAEESQNAYGKKPHRRRGGGESFSSLSPSHWHSLVGGERNAGIISHYIGKRRSGNFCFISPPKDTLF